jgi:hypothetical protein
MSAVANCAETFAAVPRRTHSTAFDLHCCGLTIAELIIGPFQERRAMCCGALSLRRDYLRPGGRALSSLSALFDALYFPRHKNWPPVDATRPQRPTLRHQLMEDQWRWPRARTVRRGEDKLALPSPCAPRLVSGSASMALSVAGAGYASDAFT